MVTDFNATLKILAKSGLEYNVKVLTFKGEESGLRIETYNGYMDYTLEGDLINVVRG